MNIPQTKIAVMLYNVREYSKTYNDFDDTLARLSDIGYEAIQVAGVNLPLEEIKELSEKHHLYICGTHENRKECVDHFDDILSKLKLFECNFLAIGGRAGDFISEKGVKEFSEEMNILGEKFRNNGIVFAFHNHHAEFVKITHTTWLEELYERTDSRNLKAELDVHWITRGGGNPEAWIRKLSKRIPVIHFKDFAIVDKEPHFCEIGEGNLDWPGIIQACEDANVRWYVIEQDKPFGNKDIFESMRISYKNLKDMGVE